MCVIVPFMANKTLTIAQLDALQRYAAYNGRTWKSQLLNDWTNGHSRGELQVLRNTHGPSWLVNFSLRRALAAIKYDAFGKAVSAS